MLSNLACTKIYDPFIETFNVHLYACCANSMGLHGGSKLRILCYLNIYAWLLFLQLN